MILFEFPTGQAPLMQEITNGRIPYFRPDYDPCDLDWLEAKGDILAAFICKDGVIFVQWKDKYGSEYTVMDAN